MKIKKSFLSLCLLLVMLTTVFSGCGATGNSTQTASEVTADDGTDTNEIDSTAQETADSVLTDDSYFKKMLTI